MLQALCSSHIPWQSARPNDARVVGLFCVLLAGLLAAGPVLAMQPMSDEQMSGVSGAGLAFGFDNFRFQAAPTSYIEQVGGEPATGTSFERGDLRWFGATVSNWRAGETATQRTTWAGTCGNGFANMGCPISTEGIGENGGSGYSNHDNPFVLRVFEYQRVGLNAAGDDWVGSPVVGGTSAGGVNRTVLDLLGPSNSQNWRWAFWGEAQSSETDGSGNITNVVGNLRNQNLILGKPAAFSKPPSLFGRDQATNPMDGSVLRMFQYRGNRVDGSGATILDETMGLFYHHRLSGNYRFSLNQTLATGDTDPVPQFSDHEGLYFIDVNAYLPLGQLYYQAVVLDSVKPAGGGAGDGNFIIELTRIPNDLQAYEDFYSVAGAIGDPEGGYQRAGRNDRYYQTHGYVEWGDYFPNCAAGGTNCIAGSGTDNDFRFSGPGYDSSTPETVTLPARVVNIQNFPGPLCPSNDGECQYYTGNIAQEATATLSSGDITTTTTRQDIAEAPGISFISSDPTSTWEVQYNQNSTYLERDRAILEWRSREVSRPDPCGGFFEPGCEYGLDVSNPNPPDPNNAPAELTGLSPHVEVNAINLGTARVEGLLVQHMKITSLGAAN